MNNSLKSVKTGLLLVMLSLVFGLVLGIIFGIAEDAVKDFIAEGIAAHPAIHDDKSQAKIWRYAQRAHFHATGIAAFSIGLIVLLMFSSISEVLQRRTAIFIGLGGLYPLSWLTMFYLAPSIGRSAAHDHWLTELFAYTGVGGLLIGIGILSAHLFMDKFTATE